MKILANKFAFLLLTTIIIGAPVGGAIYYVLNSYEPTTPQQELIAEDTSNLNARLVALPINQWVKLNSPWSSAWQRQVHAGIAFNSKNGHLIVFGSDTHGENWDNSIHEFDPVNEKWISHNMPSDHISYRVNDNNVAIAGIDELTPWAMHTFDNIVYDPQHNNLFVNAMPEHNPKSKDFEDEIQSMWIYNLDTRKWTIFKNNNKPYPKFFAGATEYDPDRDTLVAYKSGIWELGPDRKEWVRATKEDHHDIHYNMEYDTKNKEFVVFGNSKLTNTVWSYKPGINVGDKGTWTKHNSTGDIPSPDQHFPVAYDPDNAVFLLLPHNYVPNTNGDGKIRTGTASTYIYDLSKSLYTKIPTEEIAIDKMNYMMAYDTTHKVFLLVTGDWDSVPTVWAFKLVPEIASENLNMTNE